MNDLIQSLQKFADQKAQSVFQQICAVKQPEKSAPAPTQNAAPQSNKSMLTGIVLAAVGLIMFFVFDATWLKILSGVISLVGILNMFNKPKTQPNVNQAVEIDFLGIRNQVLSQVATIIERADNEWDEFVFACKDKVQAKINAASLADEAKEELLRKTYYSHKVNLTTSDLFDALAALTRDANYLANVNAAIEKYALGVKQIYGDTMNKQISVYREIESALK